ncbi:hypothetical protein PIB30_052524, partial [Stylosanthes scabra]|nr:hypothetical protein [Stylosanthes scabra]
LNWASKTGWPWPENVKFQFWPSLNELQQRKVAYATLENCIRNSVQNAFRRLQGRKLRTHSVNVAYSTWSGQSQNYSLFQCCVRNLQSPESSTFAPLHESFASKVPMPSLAFPMHFSIPKALKCASKHIKVPNGMKFNPLIAAWRVVTADTRGFTSFLSGGGGEEASGAPPEKEKNEVPRHGRRSARCRRRKRYAVVLSEGSYRVLICGVLGVKDRERKVAATQYGSSSPKIALPLGDVSYDKKTHSFLPFQIDQSKIERNWKKASAFD